MNDTNKSDKRFGRSGEWGKLSQAYRKAANKKSRRFAKKELDKSRE
jgi:hypothetical protein